MLEYFLYYGVCGVVEQVVVFWLTHWMKCTLRYTERSGDGLDPYVKYEILEGSPWQRSSPLSGCQPCCAFCGSVRGRYASTQHGYWHISFYDVVRLSTMTFYDVVRLRQNAVSLLLFEASALS